MRKVAIESNNLFSPVFLKSQGEVKQEGTRRTWSWKNREERKLGKGVLVKVVHLKLSCFLLRLAIETNICFKCDSG